MSEQEKAWLKKLLTDLRDEKNVDDYRTSSYRATILRKLS